MRPVKQGFTLALRTGSAGVRPQDHVALLCDQGLHTVVVILGVLEIWAVWVAISPDAPREYAGVVPGSPFGVG